MRLTRTSWRASRVLDEVWVPTTFVKRALESVSSAPVHLVPYVVEPEPPVHRYGRSHFGIEQRAFVFLYTFDLQADSSGRTRSPCCKRFGSALLVTGASLW